MSKISSPAGKNLHKSARGQSLVEFALISAFLFFLLLGIIEFSRLLFIYSVVSNAAQEGSRYGIVRPRDVIAAPAATQTAQAGGGTPYIPKQVVAAGGCNVIDKTLDKVDSIDRSAVNVNVWYDNGSGTPIVPTTRTPAPYDTQAMIKGNRINVEVTYNFRFLSPVMSALLPAGINVNIRSARTILNNGDSSQIPCAVNSTPAPIPTAVIPSVTPTDLPVPTSIPTLGPSATATSTSAPLPSGTATATTTPTRTPTAPTATSTRTPTRTATLPPGAPTYTPGPTNTVTRTSTSTPTSTPTSTATPTATNTISPTPTPKALHITLIDARKKPQNGSVLYILVQVTDDGGAPFPSATVVASAHINGNPTPYVVATLPWQYAGVYQGCPVGQYNNGDSVTVDITADAPGYIGDSVTGYQVVSGNLQCH